MKPKPNFLSISHSEYQQREAMQADAINVFGLTFLGIIFALLIVMFLVIAGNDNRRRYAQSDRDKKRAIGDTIERENRRQREQWAVK